MRALHLFFLVILIGVGYNAGAQVPQYQKCCGTASSQYPFKNNGGAKCQLWYAPTDFTTLPISGYITKIYFRAQYAGQNGTYTNFRVLMKQPASGTGFATSTAFETTGMIQAHYNPLESITGPAVAGDWYSITLSTPFLYDNTKALVVETQYDAPFGGTGFDNFGSSTTLFRKIYASSLTATTGSASNGFWQDFGMDMIPPGPCTSPPNAGTATASLSNVCSGGSVMLNLTGNTTGTGQTYQWQYSSVLAGPYTNMGTASSNTSLVINPTTSYYYRAEVVCNSNIQHSVPVQVTVPPLFPTGTYTINSASATGGTNFASFTDATAAISCGIAGPVTFNVSNGPYNEQMILPSIFGTSATNTITFNGNGNTIGFSSANTNERATIKLNGTDYVTINNLVINASAGTYGYGVQIMNDADNNTINGCTINSSTSSTSTTNFAGVVINNAPAAIVTAGATLCDNNIINNNTITGGQSGIALQANGATSVINNNQITNNTITDFYTYGVYLNGGVNTLIEGNNISRPTRTTTAASPAGVYLTGVSTNSRISKNKVHNFYDAMLTNAGAFYGVYLTTCDATAGNENIVSNNIVYNVIGGLGNQNGFLNNSSDYAKAYYNTFLLDDAASTTTNGTRGFYVQAATTAVEFKNNIVSIGRGGTGEKQGIYLDAVATTFTASNNNYHISSSTGLIELAHIGPAATGTGYTTIAALQTGTGQEAGSANIDPVFTAPTTGNLMPTAVSLDNLGTPIAGITTDITNVTRNATTPDMGAYEFGAGPACAAPTGLSATAVTYTTGTLSWTAVAGAIGYEYAYNTSSTPPASGTQQTGTSYNATNFTPATTYYLHVRTQCATSTFSAWTTITFTTPTCNAPTGLAATNITTSGADLSWTAVAGATGYEYALTTTSTLPASGTNTATTTFSPSGLTAATNYCLHVRTVCATGVYSGWSTYCFNTSAAPVCNPPSAPVISNITATTADVTWGAVAGASGYEYEVSTNTTPPATGTTTTGTTYSAGPLTGNTTYYAHVRSDCGVIGFSGWVTTSFNTADTCLPPTATVTNITDTTADINWAAMAGALSYEYEVSTNATPPANGTNITATTYSATLLAKNTQHYVHLRTICTNDTSSWSTANFTTTNVTSVQLVGKNGASLAVYPNPTSGLMMVKITGLNEVNATLTLSDVTGKIVKVVSLTQNKTEIDLSALTSGVYLLRYADDTGNSTIRVIKE